MGQDERQDERQVVRFDGWQDTYAGEREEKKALRKTLLRFQIQKDQELFGRASSFAKPRGPYCGGP